MLWVAAQKFHGLEMLLNNNSEKDNEKCYCKL